MKYLIAILILILQSVFPQANDLDVQAQGEQNQTLRLNGQQHDGSNLCPTSEHTVSVVGLPTYSNRNPPLNLPCMTIYSSPQVYQQAEIKQVMTILPTGTPAIEKLILIFKTVMSY